LCFPQKENKKKTEEEKEKNVIPEEERRSITAHKKENVGHALKESSLALTATKRGNVPSSVGGGNLCRRGEDKRIAICRRQAEKEVFKEGGKKG